MTSAGAGVGLLALLALAAAHAAVAVGDGHRLPVPRVRRGHWRELTGPVVSWATRSHHRHSGLGDLPPLLEAVAARLRGGGSLGQALVEVQPPAGSDLASQWRRLGDLVPAIGTLAALEDWAARAGDRGVRLAAAALVVAAETGGSPARAVDGVAATLRGRIALADEIRALSSQARASAVVITLAPLFFGILAALVDPTAAGFFRTPGGIVLVLGGLTLDAVGAWWMLHLCRGAGR